MYIESETVFTDERLVNRFGLIDGINETIGFARDNTDIWASGEINRLVSVGQELCALVSGEISLEPVASVVKEMIGLGQYQGTRFDLPIVERRSGGCHYSWPHVGSYRGDAMAMLERRLAMAKLYLIDAELADEFMRREIVGFHGTGAIDLASVLEHGLLTHREQSERGLRTFSGERLSPNGPASFTSFVEWDKYATSESYARRFGRVGLVTLQESLTSLPTEYEWAARKVEEQQDMIGLIEANEITPWQSQRLSDPFEVILGLSSDVFNRRSRVSVNSDIETEFGFMGWGVAIEYVPLILVPKDRVDVTRSAVEKYAENPDDHLVADKALVARSLDRRVELPHLVNQWAK